MSNIEDMVNHDWGKIPDEQKIQKQNIGNFVKSILIFVLGAYIISFILFFRLRSNNLDTYFFIVTIIAFLMFIYGALSILGRYATKSSTMMAEGIGGGAIAQNQSKDGSLPKSRESLVPFDGVFSSITAAIILIPIFIYYAFFYSSPYS